MRGACGDCLHCRVHPVHWEFPDVPPLRRCSVSVCVGVTLVQASFVGLAGLEQLGVSGAE